MTTAQARVVDPVLTTVAQGYKNAEMIGSVLFPYAPVGQRGGRIIAFGREDFRLYATGRAPGTNTKRVQYGHTSSPFALEQHALEGMVPFELMEEASAVPGIDLGSGAVRKTQNTIALRTEKAQADLATTAANYAAANKVTLAGADQWSDYSGTSHPVQDIEAAKEAVRAKTGKRPNTVVMGAKVWSSLKEHPDVIERIKYTGRDSATKELIAQLFQVQRVEVGDAVYENDAGALVDVWGTFVIVAYTEIASAADLGVPSYGYTYRLSGYPIVEIPYQDRNAKSWIYPVTDEVSPVIAAADGGYLISAAVA
jgi:Phage major capsid protein E.